MAGPILAGRLLLAVVLVVAGAGKLVDLAGSRAAVERFGIPRRLAAPIGTLLPPLELALGLLLVPAATAPWAAACAAALLGVFAVAVGRSLARGELVECNCFGSLHAGRIGRGSLIRNLALAAAAAMVAVADRHGNAPWLFDWVGRLSTAGAVALALGAVTAGHMAFSWQLFRQNGRLLDRIETLEDGGGAPAPRRGLPVGELAPPFALPDLDGELVDLDAVLDAGRGAVLVFTDPGCGACDTMLPAVAQAQAADGGPPVLVISRGGERAVRAKAREHGVARVLLEDELFDRERYEIHGVPAALELDEHGLVARKLAMGSQEVVSLIETACLPAGHGLLTPAADR